MKKIHLSLLLLFSLNFQAQDAYQIVFNLKNYNDTVAYLAKYTFGKQYVVDTSSKVLKGAFDFRGKTPLEKGIYFLVNQSRSRVLDFIVNENDRIAISSDMNALEMNLHANGSKENEEFFNYTRFFMKKNKEFGDLRAKTKGMSTTDSTKFMQQKAVEFTSEVSKFEAELLQKHKGTFFGDWLNLKTEKEPKTIPAQKSAADSAYYRFSYYKSHYWDGVNFGDDRLLRTQFMLDKVSKYFEQLVQQLGPDSVIVEIDKILKQCKPESQMFNYLFVHFMITYENHKLMGFDKVFVHLTDEYVKKGAVKKLYDEKTTGKIIEKSDRMKPTLIGKVAPELFMIDTTNAKPLIKMGFDTVTTGESVTKLYTANVQKIAPLFTVLSTIKAKYTVLAFWDVECSHCKTEIPKLLATYHELAKKHDIKVFSVYTQTEYVKWCKYIRDNKLDFINVYDPIYMNNVKEKYDIFTTPKLLLLDSNKVILSKNFPVEKLTEIIEIHESAAKKTTR